MRICVVYDCLFPHTVGGAERWYANLAERFAREGHEVTYVTLRQWERGASPKIDPRVRVITAGPRMSLYTASGRRRILPPLVFGAGALAHIVRAGRRYDAVHTCAFPYFALLAVALVRPLWSYDLVVDWHEVWSLAYWRSYLGRVGGSIGALVQRLCVRVPQRAFCFSQLHARRLRAEGLRGDVTVLRGEYWGATDRRSPSPAQPVVLFAARLIPEKQAPLAVAAISAARERIDGLRAEFLGDGPDRAALEAAVKRHGLEDVIRLRGFVPSAEVEQRMRSSLCLLLTSRREGYGLVVVEAARWGTPSVVVAGEDNAATELIEEDANGLIAPVADAGVIADAIVHVNDAGMALRERTAEWFGRNVDSLSLDASLRVVLDSYERAARS